MKKKCVLSALMCAALTLCAVDGFAKEQPAQEPAKIALPPLPAGVEELQFTEFYKMPVGPQGLEPTAKLQSLNNKRVRIVGHMAHEDDPTAGIFMLAKRPTNVPEKADGMADDLPSAIISVYMPPQDKDKIMAYRPGVWALTGTLQLGNHEDPNGRISYARLIMDEKDMPSPPPAKPNKKTPHQ